MGLLLDEIRPYLAARRRARAHRHARPVRRTPRCARRPRATCLLRRPPRPAEAASPSHRPRSGDVFDDLDELVEAVPLLAGELDELFCSLDDGASFGCARDGDATPPAKLEQSFLAERS